MERWLLRTGGALAVAVSIGLLISLIVRPTAEVNWLNGYTLLIASIGGVIAVTAPKRPRRAVASLVLLLAALAPVLSWISFLYWPSLLMILAGLALPFARRAVGRPG